MKIDEWMKITCTISFITFLIGIAVASFLVSGCEDKDKYIKAERERQIVGFLAEQYCKEIRPMQEEKCKKLSIKMQWFYGYFTENCFELYESTRIQIEFANALQFTHLNTCSFITNRKPTDKVSLSDNNVHLNFVHFNIETVVKLLNEK
jgi:hypothetical protein